MQGRVHDTRIYTGYGTRGTAQDTGYLVQDEIARGIQETGYSMIQDYSISSAPRIEPTDGNS